MVRGNELKRVWGGGNTTKESLEEMLQKARSAANRTFKGRTEKGGRVEKEFKKRK